MTKIYNCCINRTHAKAISPHFILISVPKAFRFTMVLLKNTEIFNKKNFFLLQQIFFNQFVITINPQIKNISTKNHSIFPYILSRDVVTLRPSKNVQLSHVTSDSQVKPLTMPIPVSNEIQPSPSPPPPHVISGNGDKNSSNLTLKNYTNFSPETIIIDDMSYGNVEISQKNNENDASHKRMNKTQNDTISESFNRFWKRGNPLGPTANTKFCIGDNSLIPRKMISR